MKIAYFDTFSGISGDMTLGALLACGSSLDHLRESLKALKIDGIGVTIEEVSRSGIGAIDVTVTQPPDKGHGRHLSDITDILDASTLSERVKSQTLAIFTRLAQAEAKIHQTTVDKIHFHEVGAIDAIVDITGVCILLEQLGVDAIASSPIPWARGFVDCQHGTMPLPAILTGLGAKYGQAPTMTIEASGYGAGKKEFGEKPNLLRVVIGEGLPSERSGVSEVLQIETNVDDLSPQLVEPLADKLREAGAIEVYTTSAAMKKGRPGLLITALAPEAAADAVIEALFRHSTSLGARYSRWERACQERSWQNVQTAYGQIRVKVGTWHGKPMNFHPEFEDARAAAEAHNLPIKTVMDAATAAYSASAV
jgi:uncharacterized protein (DUF111 family)